MKEGTTVKKGIEVYSVPAYSERCKVISRLRRLAKVPYGSQRFLVERCLGLVYDQNYFVGSAYTSESISHLADLMESQHERTCHMVDNGVELCCSKCDRRHDYDDEPQFCMGCGAKVTE